MEDVPLDALIHEKVKELAPNLPSKDREKLEEALYKLFSEKIPIRKSLDFNDDTMEYLYSYGHGLFNAAKFDRAAQMFQVLYMLEPTDLRYPLGIAASYHMGKDYEKAIAWYLALATIDENSPLPFYYMSDCLLKQGSNRASLEYLVKAAERCGEVPAYGSLKERIIRMIDSLKEELQRVPALKTGDKNL